jgi:hypothetical protein
MALHPVEAALIPYIRQFVERQKIVERALRELRPDFFLRFLNAADYFAWRRNNPISTPQAGDWGGRQEWHYFIHGGGCRLTHAETGDMLDWDAPDVDVFDWLEWALTQENVAPDLRLWTEISSYDLGEQLKIAVQHLVDHAVLKDVHAGIRYVLVNTTQE